MYGLISLFLRQNFAAPLPPGGGGRPGLSAGAYTSPCASAQTKTRLIHLFVEFPRSLVNYLPVGRKAFEYAIRDVGVPAPSGIDPGHRYIRFGIPEGPSQLAWGKRWGPWRGKLLASGHGWPSSLWDLPCGNPCAKRALSIAWKNRVKVFHTREFKNQVHGVPFWRASAGVR